jgi:leader peptidase (prepilin peptidase)/N-methyltransferase
MPPSDAFFWSIIFWLTALGAAVGSFLNVVVYRLPLGLSLIHPPSHCPKCGNPIPWHDNVPVFGWLVLRGRCRQCHDPISARYPLVEAVTAAIFAAVALAEITYLGRTNAYGLYPLHILLLCTLLSAALIEYDGRYPPWRLFLPALIAGLVVPWIWPSLRPLVEWHVLTTPLGHAIATIAVLALLAMIYRLGRSDNRFIGFALSVVCVVLLLGFMAGIIIAAVALLGFVVLRSLPRRRTHVLIRPTFVVAVFAFAWILAQPWLFSS